MFQTQAARVAICCELTRRPWVRPDARFLATPPQSLEREYGESESAGRWVLSSFDPHRPKLKERLS